MPLDEFDWKNHESWRALLNAVLSGLSLPAIGFGLSLRLRGHDLKSGSLFGLMAGLGALLMLPAAIMAKVLAEPEQSDNIVVSCMYFVMPLMGLWFFLAAWVGGMFTWRLWSQPMPWSEKYGYLLAVAWTPLGVWVLADIYHDAIW